MPPKVHLIDWREEFAHLNPYLDGQGGIVHICYQGESSAPSAFLNTLTSEFEHREGNRSSIRIDHEVYSVRYLSGIRDEFVRKMQLELPERYGVEDAHAPLNIAADIEAGGNVDVNVSDVTQNTYIGENPALMSRNRLDWSKNICTQLEEFLKDSQIMVVINHGSKEDQDEFWRYLWKDGLERLVDAGLLLVHMIDVSDQANGIHDLAPAPHLEINLPTSLGKIEQEHAIEDLTEIIMEKISSISKEEATVRADTLVGPLCGDIPRLHGQFAGLLMQLARATG